ncbi:MAG: histidine phosphatase family protein [Planctomycetaceae bacterium]|nr:histidine phosphatase family protein [Planctomycetaceae bacterium]
MSQILLIRPGSTSFDEQQRLQGMLDLPLSSKGEEQVAALLGSLGLVAIDLIYTATCEPAQTTAAYLGAARGVPVKEIEDLHNVNLGLWQGLQVEEIRRKHPKVFKQWQESPEAICPPEGETFAEAIERVRKALEKPLKKKGNLALVAAEPLASIIAAIVRGQPLENATRACNGGCGTWEVLRENPYKSLSGEFVVSPELAATRAH